jgi:superoxide dismutase
MKTETTIKWDGEDHVVPLSMKLVNAIENANVNLMQMAIDISAGGVPKTSLVATMYSIMLNAAGCFVTSQEVWDAMIKSKTVEITGYANAAINDFFPETENPKSKTTKRVKKTKR